jgi:hypothetical protein
MKVLKSHEKVLKHLFDSDENLLRTDNNPKGLTQSQIDIKQRCMIIYSRKIADPLIADKTLLDELMNQFDVKEWTVYNDIRAVEYIRFMVNESQKKALAFEVESLEKAQTDKKYFNTKPLSAASKVLVDANNLDKEDSGIDPANFQIPQIQISADVTDIDIEPMDADKVAMLKEKYLKGVKDAEIISDDE